jgi:hypothetical protein
MSSWSANRQLSLVAPRLVAKPYHYWLDWAANAIGSDKPAFWKVKPTPGSMIRESRRSLP